MENKIVEQNKHISTDEIKRDIFETVQEITTMQRELKGFEMLEDRMSYIKVSAIKSGIKEREAFVKKLQFILETRNKK